MPTILTQKNLPQVGNDISSLLKGKFWEIHSNSNATTFTVVQEVEQLHDKIVIRLGEGAFIELPLGTQFYLQPCPAGFEGQIADKAEFFLPDAFGNAYFFTLPENEPIEE